MIAARIFAVLASVLLVAAVALAALSPAGASLGQMIMLAEPRTVPWMTGHAPDWFWTWLELPFLLRPPWLIPAGLGLVCAGAAGSLTWSRQAAPHRRS